MRNSKIGGSSTPYTSMGSINENLHKACFELLENHPEFSVKTGLTTPQKLFLFCAVITFIGSLSLDWMSYSHIAIGCSFLFIGQILFRFYAALTMKSTDKPENSSVSPAPTPLRLPKFTILIPLYREEAVVKRSVEAMKSLNYPSNLIEVFYLTESDDIATEDAVKNAILDTCFKLISVPAQAPRTKPKALNFGLKFASGDIVTIYDAEDIPHPDQLTAVAHTYQNAKNNLAVVQCPLHAYNGNESWIARQFDLEYAIHFDVWLPAMTRLGWPIPLGGTSNHFNRGFLTKVGAWDPFNVTEDADLGFRLAKPDFQLIWCRTQHWKKLR